MDNCIFCRIVSRDLNAEIVYEDESAIAFLDINPIAPGHTVAVPKKHAANIFDLEEKELGGIFAAVRNVMKSIQAGMNPAGFNYGVNHGRVAGQAIEHLHVHILPRFENDGGGSMHSVVRNPPRQQTIEDIAGLIRGAGGFKQAEKKEEPKAQAAPTKTPEKKEEGLEEKLKELEAEVAKHLKTLQRMKRP